MTTIIGYARTSTVEQIAGLEAQHRDLEAAGVKKLFRKECRRSRTGPNLNVRWTISEMATPSSSPSWIGLPGR
jgi:DNA invertase Pin-like site-specific DNA recombinase